MPVFRPNTPIETRTPVIQVDRLPEGRHRFRLVVFDNDGNASRPDDVVVLVRRRDLPPPGRPPGRPTLPGRPVTPGGTVVADPRRRV